MDFADRFEALPKNVQEIFASNEPRITQEEACFLYNIPENDIQKITQVVADIFLKDLLLLKFPEAIQKNLATSREISYGIAFEIARKIFLPCPEYFLDVKALIDDWKGKKINSLVSEEKAKRRLHELEPWILEEEKEKKEEIRVEKSKTVSVSVTEALAKYPNLGEQSVTESQMKLKYFPTPVRPSIKNWITDYHDNMGAGKHSPIDRGNYLFHSDNGKKLTSGERQKLSVILKSLDENSLVAIDPVGQQVVFNAEVGGEINKKSTEDKMQSGEILKQVQNDKTRNLNSRLRENDNSDRAASDLRGLDSHLYHEGTSLRSRENDKIGQAENVVDLRQNPVEVKVPKENLASDDDYFSQQRSAAPASKALDSRLRGNDSGEAMQIAQAPQVKREVAPEEDDVFARFASRSSAISRPAPQNAAEKIIEQKPVQAPNFLHAISGNKSPSAVSGRSNPQIIKRRDIFEENSAPQAGSVSFSSPQKFSAETKQVEKSQAQKQNISPVANIPAQQIPKKTAPDAPYTIKPRNYFDN